MKKIYIFGARGADFGTIADSLRLACPKHRICIVDRADVLSADFNPRQVAAFVLPGASRGAYDEKLGADGIAAIKKYVCDGGTFAGFCAGAYFASEKIEWRLETPEKRKVKSPVLNFFNGIARGPVPRLLSCDNTNWEWGHMTAVPITAKLPLSAAFNMRALYCGGPQFIGAADGFNVLARFESLQGKPPAVMTRPYGRGRVLLSAIHPEVSPEQLRPFTQSRVNSLAYIKNVLETLEKDEPFRTALWFYMADFISGEKPKNQGVKYDRN